jgi:hypothetical protein
MKLTGHKTESAYRRDAIADERDLRIAVERLDALFDRQTLRFCPQPPNAVRSHIDRWTPTCETRSSI